MRSYQQYCPLARALDVVGDRWAMLVMRELVFAPKRFTDLQARLDGIAPNLLSRRLKELEAAGLVTRRRLNPPAATTVYELTSTGRTLEPAMLELARWGTQFLGSYQGDEAFNLEWLLPVMEEMADREAARGIYETYEFVVDGVPFWVKVDDGEVAIRAGHAPGAADLLIETDFATFMAVGFGSLSAEDARSQGRSRVVGDVDKVETALDILAPIRALSKVTTPA